jgi:hypothetical protein
MIPPGPGPADVGGSVVGSGTIEIPDVSDWSCGGLLARDLSMLSEKCKSPSLWSP